MTDYKIKPGYIERPEPAYCVDKPDGNLWQWDAYVKARDIAIEANAEWIIDIGCGSGEKASLFEGFEYIGIDYGPNIADSSANAMDGYYLDFDLDKEPIQLAFPNCVIVCADVVEHLKNPSLLLGRLAEFAPLVKGIVLSTPDRDLTHGADHNGPPPNVCHVREWNKAELQSYLESSGFPIKTIGHIPCRKDDERRITIMVTA